VENFKLEQESLQDCENFNRNGINNHVFRHSRHLRLFSIAVQSLCVTLKHPFEFK